MCYYCEAISPTGNSRGLNLDILTTCHKINVEAAAVLYGHNQFVFDDMCNGMICDMCEEELESNLTTMYQWLCEIGEQNRCMLRRIQIRSSRDEFMVHNSKLWYGYTPGLRYCYYSQDMLGKAFSLLAKGHNLERIEITFPMETFHTKCYQWLFSHGLDSRFLLSLMEIKNLEEFRLSPGPEQEEHVKLLKEMKSVMERGQQEISNGGAGVKRNASDLTIEPARKKQELDIIIGDV